MTNAAAIFIALDVSFKAHDAILTHTMQTNHKSILCVSPDPVDKGRVAWEKLHKTWEDTLEEYISSRLPETSFKVGAHTFKISKNTCPSA